MRYYPFIEEPASPLRMLSALTRAGLRAPGPALVVREPGTRAQDLPTLHSQPACHLITRPGELAVVTQDEFYDLGYTADVELCDCGMAEDSLLGRWVDDRGELATALIALEAADDLVPLPDDGHFDAFDVTGGDMDLFGYDICTQTTLGWLSAIAIALRCPPVVGEPSTADLLVQQMTDEAIAALEQAVTERLPWVHAVPEGPMERWLLRGVDAYLTDPVSGSMLPMVQRVAFRALVVGRFVGFLHTNPTNIFVHAPAGLFPRDQNVGQYLGLADPADTEQSMTSLYHAFVDISKDLRRAGTSQVEAEQAALVSLLAAPTSRACA